MVMQSVPGDARGAAPEVGTGSPTWMREVYVVRGEGSWYCHGMGPMAWASNYNIAIRYRGLMLLNVVVVVVHRPHP